MPAVYGALRHVAKGAWSKINVWETHAIKFPRRQNKPFRHSSIHSFLPSILHSFMFPENFQFTKFGSIGGEKTFSHLALAIPRLNKPRKTENRDTANRREPFNVSSSYEQVLKWDQTSHGNKGRGPTLIVLPGRHAVALPCSLGYEQSWMVRRHRMTKHFISRRSRIIWHSEPRRGAKHLPVHGFCTGTIDRAGL